MKEVHVDNEQIKSYKLEAEEKDLYLLVATLQLERAESPIVTCEILLLKQN